MLGFFGVRQPLRKMLQRLTIHGVHSLKGYDLWSGGVRLLQELPQVVDVVVAKDKLLGSTVPDPLDH